MAAENREAQLAELLRGVADSSENDFRFAGAGLSTSDDEDTDRGTGGAVAGASEFLLRRNRDREVGADGNEMSARGRAREPRELFERKVKMARSAAVRARRIVWS